MKNKKERAITLIALIITIILLLILASVAIVTLTGNNGLFIRAKQAKVSYSISSAKEKLELAISDLMLEQTSKGENLVKEDLSKINNDEIDVRSIDNFPVEVICQSYKFNIDENFIVTYVGEANETIITYTTEPEGYTNKDEVKILVKISNPKGIKSIQKPGETDKILPQGQTEIGIDYKVTANGTYTFKTVDNENKETIKDIVIEQIDKEAPKDFIPSVKDIKSTKFTIVADVEDGEKTDVSVKSGIEKYEFYVNGTKYESKSNTCTIENLGRNTQYTVYVIVYDKATNFKKSNSINVTTTNGDYPTLTLNGFVLPDDGLATDALQKDAYDNNFSTGEAYVGTHKYYKISPECWGKYMTFYHKESIGFVNFGSSYNKINDIMSSWLDGVAGKNLIARSILIPSGSYWGALSTGTSSYSIAVYEVWCSDENLTGNTYSNENRP